jgi:hypothetical protein
MKIPIAKNKPEEEALAKSEVDLSELNTARGECVMYGYYTSNKLLSSQIPPNKRGQPWTFLLSP